MDPLGNPSRWWEDEGRFILYGWDFPLIHSVIRFGLFNDIKTEILNRDETFINDLAKSLQLDEAISLSNYSRDRKIDEILRCSRFSRPPKYAWRWFPEQVRQETRPLTIAEMIDNESCLQFKAVPFEAWVRYALEYKDIAVDWFLLQHEAFYLLLSGFLKTYPDEFCKYEEVEKVCSLDHTSVFSG
jgi:hypothetical protein